MRVTARYFGPGIAAVSILASVGIWRVATAPAANEAAVVTVAPAPFEVAIAAVGDLVPAHRRLITAPYSAKVNEMVAEGTAVKPGQVVARLDTADLDERLSEVEQKLETLAQAAEVRDLSARRAQERQRIEIAAATHDLRLQQVLLSQGEAGMPARERVELDLRAEAAAKALAHARQQAAARKDLLARGILRPVDVKQGEVELARANKANAVAVASVALARRGTPGPRLAARRLAVRKAANKLALAKGSFANLQATAVLAQAVDEAEVAFNKARRNEHARQIALAKLLAPATGVLVYQAVYVRGGGLRKLQVGDEAREDYAFLEVADVSKFRVKLRVREVDLGKVWVGMPARLRATGVPEDLPARLASLGVLATEQPDAVNREGAARGFEAWVDTDRTSTLFRPGMTVDVSLIQKTWPDAIAIPTTAIVREAGTAFVWVQPPRGGVERRTIATGERSGDKTRVVSGLGAGDVVLREPPGAHDVEDAP